MVRARNADPAQSGGGRRRAALVVVGAVFSLARSTQHSTAPRPLSGPMSRFVRAGLSDDLTLSPGALALPPPLSSRLILIISSPASWLSGPQTSGHTFSSRCAPSSSSAASSATTSPATSQSRQRSSPSSSSASSASLSPTSPHLTSPHRLRQADLPSCVARRRALTRAQLLRANSSHLAPAAFNSLRAHLQTALEDGSYLKKPAPPEGSSPANPLDNPQDMEQMMDGMTDMMKKQAVGFVPQVRRSLPLSPRVPREQQLTFPLSLSTDADGNHVPRQQVLCRHAPRCVRSPRPAHLHGLSS